MRESSGIHSIFEELEIQTVERLCSDPLPHWVERMTVGYLNSHGSTATRKRSWWDLNWVDGQGTSPMCVQRPGREHLTDATLLTLENCRVRGPALNLPQIVAWSVFALCKYERIASRYLRLLGTV